MFKNPFSFNGRIRRTEFALSFIIYLFVYFVILAFLGKAIASGGYGYNVLWLIFIPLVWFLWAQGAKRCHDLNKSGWWQIIPFYIFWMLFQSSVDLYNQYGGESTVYGAADYEKPYDADSLAVNQVEIPNSDSPVE
jgi:uncharacterized membrane protein YhaH (DUF805 family)